MSWQYPPNDLWCEFLSHEDGDWGSWFYGPGWHNILPDIVDYKVGALSIAMECGSHYYGPTYRALILNFKEGRELNLTNADDLEFWVKMSRFNGNGGFRPFLTTDLCSPTGKATKNFTIHINEWELIKCGVGPRHLEEWIVPLEFDWTQINAIWFYFEQNAANTPFSFPTEVFKLDGFLLNFLLNIAFITVESNPIKGVPVRLDEAAYANTPITFQVEPPSPRIVTVADVYDSWRFDHWEDGTTTPGRLIDASLPGFYRSTAFYASPPAPPKPVWRAGYYVEYYAKYLRRLIEAFLKQKR